MGWRPAKAWTSCSSVSGYRHFYLVTQGGRGGDRWVELAAVLAPFHRERVLWSEMRDRSRWLSGFQQVLESDENPAAE